MEKYVPDFTENFSTAKSPQQMRSALYTDHLGATAANSGEKAARGAVLVSPCLSHGEREIMRRAHATGGRVILLRNKGFSRHEKPSGALFDACAQGKLLLLAPASWHYLPGEVPPTRERALILNHIARLLAVSGEALNTPPPIPYRGTTLPDLLPLLLQACTPPSP